MEAECIKAGGDGRRTTDGEEGKRSGWISVLRLTSLILALVIVGLREKKNRRSG